VFGTSTIPTAKNMHLELSTVRREFSHTSVLQSVSGIPRQSDALLHVQLTETIHSSEIDSKYVDSLTLAAGYSRTCWRSSPEETNSDSTRTRLSRKHICGAQVCYKQGSSAAATHATCIERMQLEGSLQGGTTKHKVTQHPGLVRTHLR
jgi:hypothetical protein